jgi:uncharacterized membrane protein
MFEPDTSVNPCVRTKLTKGDDHTSDSQQQGIAAVGFLVAASTDAMAADQALDAMKAAKQQQQFYFEDAAVIRQDAQGKAYYHETDDLSTGEGAGIGAQVGGVLGIQAFRPRKA